MRKICLLLIFTIALAAPILAQDNNAPETGTIKGNLIYTSNLIPPGIILCATRILKVSYTVCSTSADKKGIGFTIDVANKNYAILMPPGDYYVYATFPKGRAPSADLEDYRAYYTEFIRCGMGPKCKSHKKIKIRVRNGRTTSGITIGDWYN